ncbi:hypothetical protein GLOTRDRAFT_128038 [Gloeophyllum trabeum ATCC 11539]|uniref:Uncharacterized protein n=1 Tax=Gloeophyllum trabeum (strain ATCC 11539 / FP-39264 / Madison 617) TaxID=670483 RepID=S7RNL4_GLOTA|nr:uncharacterized protein GLOTRDRAFT_128038 [Gloeophyllum trabeum ATCC 11539]EPQ56080.1 hypothetical protein GLOTRDRAFT_128038 [Gloeophyllum trabeum ATCC 11539]
MRDYCNDDMAHTAQELQLGGAVNLLKELNQVAFEVAEDEQDQEIEAFESGVDIDKCQESNPSYLRTPPASQKLQAPSPSSHKELSQNLKKASEQIIVTNTRKEYNRLWASFTQFCAAIGYAATASAVDAMFPNLPAAFPEWIAVWIMDR